MLMLMVLVLTLLSSYIRVRALGAGKWDVLLVSGNTDSLFLSLQKLVALWVLFCNVTSAPCNSHPRGSVVGCDTICMVIQSGVAL